MSRSLLQTPLRPSLSCLGPVALLWELTPSARVAAMRRGELTLAQCAAWASRYPEQVPLVNGEFEFLAAHTLEVPG